MYIKEDGEKVDPMFGTINEREGSIMFTIARVLLS